MVVWCSRPRRPPEKKKLGSFASRPCNDGKKKRRDPRAKSLFCQSNLILLFCGSCCCPYMYVWIHGHNKKPLNLKPILLVTMLL